MQNILNINIFVTKQTANHVGIITTLFIFQLFLLSAVPCKVVAQTGRGESSPPLKDQYATENPLKVSPGMAILLVGLVGTFFMMGCVSVYARQCIDAWSGRQGSGGLPAININRRSGRARNGIDPTVIETFPMFLYSDVKGLKIGKAALECAVCLNEFEDEATLRLLPKCCHVFHPECIDTWLASHVTCPVCRADLVPGPGEEIINICNLERAESNSGSAQFTQSPEVQGERINEISEIPIDFSIGSPGETNPVRSPIPNHESKGTPKSPPTFWKFLRSHSTGHSLTQPGEDYERFTLRLPEGLQQMLKTPELRRAASNAPFQTERSPRRWFRRSTSVGTGSGRSNNNVDYERFDKKIKPDGSKTNITATGSLIKSVKSPFERLFSGREKDDEVGERSFARLTGNNPV